MTCCKPLIVRWAPLFISSTIRSKNKKSAPFCVSRGYFLKWGITIELKSLRLAVEYFNTLAFLSKLIVPIPSKKSFSW